MQCVVAGITHLRVENACKIPKPSAVKLKRMNIKRDKPYLKNIVTFKIQTLNDKHEKIVGNINSGVFTDY
jgi:hypothetical protein